MLKKAQVEIHMQRETQRGRQTTALNSQEGESSFICLFMKEVSRQAGTGEGMIKNTGAYIKPKPVKSRAINADAGTPGDYPMLVFGDPV